MHNRIQLVLAYVCMVMFFGMFWVCGTVLSGIAFELSPLSTWARPLNYLVIEGWVSGTGGTLFAIGMIRWMNFRPREWLDKVNEPPPTKRRRLPPATPQSATILEFRRKAS